MPLLTNSRAEPFIDMAFGNPIYERLRALGFKKVFEVNFGLTHTRTAVRRQKSVMPWNQELEIPRECVWQLHVTPCYNREFVPEFIHARGDPRLLPKSKRHGP